MKQATLFRLYSMFLILGIIAVILFAYKVSAQERQIGTILVSDAGTGSNFNTGYGSAVCAVGEACAQAFAIPSNVPITIQCDPYGAVVAIARATNDAGIGVILAADQALFTSSGQNVVGVTRPDGGVTTSASGACVSIAPLAGAANAVCRVSTRTGLE